MEGMYDHPQLHAPGMPFESPQKLQPVGGNGCPTPPGASPVKHDFVGGSAMMPQHGSGSSSSTSPQAAPAPKHVSFELLLDDHSKMRARIPMRVQIFPHDTTDSIVTTVKNFYGIYEATASGVSFEDENGTTLIARYENLRNNMTVYVRVIPSQDYPDVYSPSHSHHQQHHQHHHHHQQQQHPQPYYGSAQLSHGEPFINRPALGEPFQMPPPQAALGQDYAQSPSRPGSRVARKRSTSPSGRGRRSASAAHKASSRAGNKSRGSSTHGSFHEDALAHYSDSDGSKKAKSDQFASSDISMENILLDGRRKRPKFDSSELPLFAPPQVPIATSTSSISPQRRSIAQEAASPFSGSAQRPFLGNQQPLPSPQSFGHHEQLHALHNNVSHQQQYSTPTGPQHGHKLRDRTKIQPATYYPNSGGNRTSGSGILPTPDPTIASCISDEDVAMQLIRLGDASNFSHGRNSTSTVDDAFSGVADAASSAGATSDGSDASADDADENVPLQSRQSEPGSMLPPGSTPHRKSLDEILPSCDTSDPSSDEAKFYQQPHAINGPNNLNKSTFVDDRRQEADDPRYGANGAKRVKHNNPSKGTGSKPKPAASKQALSSSSKTNKQPKQPRPSQGQGSQGSQGSRKGKAPPVSTTNSNNNNKSMGPPPPANMLHTAPRSTANTQPHQLAAGEEDLSTKPRCQRCRKSKKGCDRQRPCQRCKDAGIGAEGCISEDEGNGRKGRYGRHMGVPVNTAVPDASAGAGAGAPMAAAGFVPEYPVAAPIHHPPGVPTSTPSDKNKKRKR